MATERKRIKIGYDGDAAVGAADGPVTNAVLPSANLKGLDTDDNAAIALKLLPAGTPLVVGGTLIGTCGFDIPEGHRFTVTAIPKGAEITSWGLVFGIAARDLGPAEYLCNPKVLLRMADDTSGLNLPSEPTFVNPPFHRHIIDKATFQPTPSPVVGDVLPTGATFNGIPRPDGRGTGTRNYVVMIGITGDVAGFARAVANAYDDPEGLTARGIDGVVAVAHTEGAGDSTTPAASNEDKIIRTLAAYVCHPNVGAVCLIDRPGNRLGTTQITDFLSENRYPTASVTLKCFTVDSRAAVADEMARAASVVTELVEAASGAKREPRPVSELVMAQQCGGSDAFSGISANPLIGWVSRQIVADGGGVVLAETDELIGAESYVLSKLRDYETGQKFLELVDRFYEYTGQHGHSPEGNPSGGNLYRGLYNIILKSAGAAMKKSPDVRLDHVLEYGESLGPRKGFCFMDSPGNDLESIAGQVASGCNVVAFTTGNGSITNFPFVPTVKVLTTTVRYTLLNKDMDVNAGKYLDSSQSMDELGKDTFDYILRSASGEKTRGELAGHHQVHIWREWKVAAKLGPEEPEGMRSGQPLVLGGDADGADTVPPPKLRDMALLRSPKSMPHLPPFVSDRVGLIVPTSLCSSQVSLKLSNRLNEGKAAEGGNLSRITTLPHTEGCGASSGDSEDMFIRTILGYAAHPVVSCAVLVEHGCEKTHNDRMTAVLEEMKIDPALFGYASIQLDGGIEGAATKVEKHIRSFSTDAADRVAAPPSQLRVGFASCANLPSEVARALGAVARAIVDVGGTVVATGSIVGAEFLHSLLLEAADGQNATLGYGQRAAAPGLHTMHATTSNMAELLTGLGATGVEVMIAFVEGSCVEPHPLVPVIQVTHAGMMKDADFKFDMAASECDEAQRLAELVQAVCERATVPKLFNSACTNIQISRGRKGVSL